MLIKDQGVALKENCDLQALTKGKQMMGQTIFRSFKCILLFKSKWNDAEKPDFLWAFKKEREKKNFNYCL